MQWSTQRNRMIILPALNRRWNVVMFHQSQTISYLVPVFQGNLTTAFPVCHAIWLCSVGSKKQSEHGNMIVDCRTSTHRRLHYCATWLLISYNSTYYQLVFIGLEVCTGSREANVFRWNDKESCINFRSSLMSWRPPAPGCWCEGCWGWLRFWSGYVCSSWRGNNQGGEHFKCSASASSLRI